MTFTEPEAMTAPRYTAYTAAQIEEEADRKFLDGDFPRDGCMLRQAAETERALEAFRRDLEAATDLPPVVRKMFEYRFGRTP